MIELLLKKARQALQTARRDLDDEDTDAAANRCYYAVLYAAWAMFAVRGLAQPRTHSGLIAEFGRHFVKDGPFDQRLGATLGKLFALRSYADYILEPTPRDKAEIAIETAGAFLSAVEQEIARCEPPVEPPDQPAGGEFR